MWRGEDVNPTATCQEFDKFLNLIFDVTAPSPTQKEGDMIVA